MSKSGELICAIEELEQFIQANDEAIGDDAMAPAKELDARIYALAANIGVNVPTLTAEFRQPFHAFGHTAIPVIQFRGGLIKLFALDSWKQSMEGLKETARLVGQPPPKEEDPDPISMWDDDRRVTSTRMVNAAGLEGKAKSNFLSQLDYWRKGRKAKPSETGKPIQRQKLADDSDYSEYADRKPNEAKYDYRFGAVKHLLGPFLIDRK